MSGLSYIFHITFSFMMRNYLPQRQILKHGHESGKLQKVSVLWISYFTNDFPFYLKFKELSVRVWEFTWRRICTVDPTKIKAKYLRVQFLHQDSEIYKYFCNVRAVEKSFDVGLVTEPFLSFLSTYDGHLSIRDLNCRFNLESFEKFDFFVECLRQISCEHLTIEFLEVSDKQVLDLTSIDAIRIPQICLENNTGTAFTLYAPSKDYSTKQNLLFLPNKGKVYCKSRCFTLDVIKA